MQKILYVDDCPTLMEDRIQAELGFLVVKRLEADKWNIQDSSRILTDPRIELAIFNQLDEIALMEIGLLLFMCRPILVTARCLEEYKTVQREVTYFDPACNLKEPHNNFISWFKYMQRSSDEQTN